MSYYKAFNKKLICMDMQYEIGQEYKFNKKPILCERGYHFCKTIADCYRFYPMSDNTRICEVEPLGEILENESGIKLCTNHIKIIREVKNPREKSNISKSSSGYCNIGNFNSGNWNSGNWNSGDWNSGDWNSGNCNSGDRNSGNWNSGDWNSGVWNSGDWNSGDRNSGIFNTNRNPKIKIFDYESNWTITDWYRSKAYAIMSSCPYTTTKFIDESDMSRDEKNNFPEYKTIGGYLKTIIVTKKEKQEWWDKLSDEEKQEIYDIPNFDAEKFEKCTGINVEGEM